MLFWLIFNWQNYFVKSLGYYSNDFINQNLWRPCISIFIVYLFNYYWSVCLRFCSLFLPPPFRQLQWQQLSWLCGFICFQHGVWVVYVGYIGSPCLPRQGDGRVPYHISFFDIICPKRLFFRVFQTVCQQMYWILMFSELAVATFINLVCMCACIYSRPRFPLEECGTLRVRTARNMHGVRYLLFVVSTLSYWQIIHPFVKHHYLASISPFLPWTLESEFIVDRIFIIFPSHSYVTAATGLYSIQRGVPVYLLTFPDVCWPTLWSVVLTWCGHTVG